MQPWYDKNAGNEGHFVELSAHLEDLKVRGPPMSYFLDPTKSILVVLEKNVPRVDAYLRGMGLRVVTGSR